MDKPLEYSLKRDGEKYLTKNFKIKEFRCKDGSDKILVLERLVNKLQKIRDKRGVPIIITSCYRTDSYNKKVGGADNSYHKLGEAIDFYSNDVSARVLAKDAFQLGIKGIGLYINREREFVHIDDTRDTPYYWIQDGDTTKPTFKF